LARSVENAWIISSSLAKPTFAKSSRPMPTTTTMSGRIYPWVRMRPLFVLSSGSATSPRRRSSADFIINTTGCSSRQGHLVHRPGHVGQDSRPIHCRPLPHTDPRRRHLGPSGTVYHHQDLRSDVANRLLSRPFRFFDRTGTRALSLVQGTYRATGKFA
jgi:hypothetical protein